ncbi:MAG TPA: hypothetical protein VMY41_06265 [Thermohalobaculum sp.]|nr:hypothetical protein [Thermohalobaculum sp.]
MSDVLQTAIKYRARLKSELTKVEDFLQMAENFSREIDSDDRVTFFSNDADSTTTLKQPTVDRPRSVQSGTASA